MSGLMSKDWEKVKSALMIASANYMTQNEIDFREWQAELNEKLNIVNHEEAMLIAMIVEVFRREHIFSQKPIGA